MTSSAKATVEEIRARFDADVERFSNLETGQTAVMDSPLAMELVSSAAAAVSPHARDILDIGCGAGNYTLKVLQKLAGNGGADAVNCTLIDLSRPMLDRAVERITPATRGRVRAVQGDMREIELGEEAFDIIVTASTLHHLRDDAQWQLMYDKMFCALRPRGSLWIFDLVEHEPPALERMLRERYGDYLSNLKGGGEAGAAYRAQVFAYIAAEDTPRTLGYQLDLMRKAGFAGTEVLHKSVMGAAFGGWKR